MMIPEVVTMMSAKAVARLEMALMVMMLALLPIIMLGCGSFGAGQPAEKALYGEDGARSPKDRAQAAIAEVFITSASLADTAKEHEASGLLTKGEARKIAEILEEAVGRAKEAQAMLAAGQEYAAFDHAALSKALMNAARRELIKSAAERRTR